MLIIPLVTEQEGGFHRFRKKLGIVVHKLRKSQKLTTLRDILGTEMRNRYCLPGSVFSPIVTTPYGYKPRASGMTQPCRPTASNASSKIFLLPL